MSGKRHAVAARRIFDGVAVRADSAVLIDGSDIEAVVPRAAIPATIRDTIARAAVMTRAREAIANLVSAFDCAFSEQRRAASAVVTLIAREFSRAVR